MTIEHRQGPAAGRRILIIGAGRGQAGLIRAAKRLGATTVVATLTDPQPPGHRFRKIRKSEIRI